MNKQITPEIKKSEFNVNSGIHSVIDPKIKMNLNKYGEYKPDRDLDIAHQEIIKDIDSTIQEKHNEDTIAKELYSKIPNIEFNNHIGYYINLYAGHVKEGDYRERGSSGGLGTWILKELLERKLINGVIHIKKSKENSSSIFEYGISETIEELCNNSKSKYYPAEFSNAINAIKEKEGYYAITGIPSFIMEIRLLSKYDSELKEKIKYTIGLICGHQKTTKYADCLAWQYGIKPGDLEYIDFRKKSGSNTANQYFIEMTGKVNGKKTTISQRQDKFLCGNWGHGFFKSKFSDFTDDALNETADIALGDAWLPQYIKDSKGTNVIIVRNQEILNIIHDGIKNNKLHLEEIDASTLLRSQSGLIHHIRDELPYRLYKKDKNEQWRPSKRIQAHKIDKLRAKVQDLREKIMEESHIVFEDAVKKDDWRYFERKMKKLIFQYNLLYKVIQIKNNGIVWAVSKSIKKLNEKIAKTKKTKNEL